MSWADDRFLAGMGNQAFASGLLTRIDANGLSLDPSPITLPFVPRAIVWTGNEWIAGGRRALARISAEGKVLDVEEYGEGPFGAYGLAWTGNRVVVVGSSFGEDGPITQSVTGVKALTYDAALNLDSVRNVTDTPAEVIAVAGDGQSAIALWRGVPGHSQGKAVDGFLDSSPRVVGILSASEGSSSDSSVSALVAAGINGRTVVSYVSKDPSGLPSDELKVHVFTPPAFSEASERTLTAPGALAQDFPDSASSTASLTLGASQTLVAWRERTSAHQWAVYATRLDQRAKVLDPDSLWLATPCGRTSPAVATDSRDFLVAWYDEQGISTAAIRSDGTFATRRSTTLATPCGETLMKIVSNGTDYLLVWLEKRRGIAWSLVAQRLRADGTPIDSSPLFVGRLESLFPSGVTFHAASNGQDYLIAWRGEAARVTAHGALPDKASKIPLGVGQVRTLWWNGKTYVAEMTSLEVSRFLRIGSDGTGGRSPSGPHEVPVPFPSGPGSLTIGWQSSAACDPGGCWVAGTSRHPFGRDTLTVLRYEDDGQQITIRRHEVANVSYSSVNDLSPIPAGIVNAGRPALLFLPQRMEQPFSSVHRLMIAPFEKVRGHAARHP